MSQVSYLQSSPAPIDVKAEDGQSLLLQDQEKTIEVEEDKIEEIWLFPLPVDSVRVNKLKMGGVNFTLYMVY